MVVQISPFSTTDGVSDQPEQFAIVKAGRLERVKLSVRSKAVGDCAL
jgi:hypothetical protein